MDTTKLTPSDLSKLALQQIAIRCKTDLFFLAKEILGYDKMTKHTHQDLCDYTTSVLPNPPEVSVEGFDPRKNLLLLLMPRGTFKSSVVTIGLTLQFILNEPNCRILLDSETFSKSKAFLREILGHLENNYKYREVFRAIHGMLPFESKNKARLWTDSEIILPCRTRDRKEPTISCAGIDVTKNGMHYDIIIADDLHSEKNVTNKEQIQQVIDHYKFAFSLLDPGQPMVIIGTRWDYSDLYQHIIDFEQEDFNILKRSAYNPDGSLFFPEVLTEKELDKIRRRQGTGIFCNPGEAPILMADWSTKRLDQIKIGDEIIGFENGEGQRNVGQTFNKLVKTKVLSISKSRRETQTVDLESGRRIRCTPDHEWYTGRKDATHRPYAPVVVGRKMMQVIDTDEKIGSDTQHDWGWLSGMLDGEGACKYGSIAIHQYPKSNPEVYKRIGETLERLALPYRQYEKSFVINGGRQSKFDILRYAKPAKSFQIINTLWDKHTRLTVKKDRVVKIIPNGPEDVYGLETGTGNYVAWGYASRNSKQYLNEPVSDENATFKRDYIKRCPLQQIIGRPINWYLVVDPSYTDPRSVGNYSDFAALVLVGMDYMHELYVRHIVRQKMTYSQIIDQMFSIYQDEKFKDIKNLKIILEVIGTKSLSFELANEQKRRNLWLPVTEIKSRAASKEERIRGLAPFYEYGHVYHIQECPNVEELEYELLHFPTGRHDDMIDCLSTVLEVATSPNNNKREYGTDGLVKHRTSYKPRSPITGV